MLSICVCGGSTICVCVFFFFCWMPFSEYGEKKTLFSTTFNMLKIVFYCAAADYIVGVFNFDNPSENQLVELLLLLCAILSNNALIQFTALFVWILSIFQSSFRVPISIFVVDIKQQHNSNLTSVATTRINKQTYR